MYSLLPFSLHYKQRQNSRHFVYKSIRISVVKDGIYQITPSDLKTWAFQLKNRFRTFRLSRKTRDSIYVTNSHKSRLGPDDRILFYGRALRGKQLLRTVFKYQLLLAYLGGALGARVEGFRQPRKRSFTVLHYRRIGRSVILSTLYILNTTILSFTWKCGRHSSDESQIRH